MSFATLTKCERWLECFICCPAIWLGWTWFKSEICRQSILPTQWLAMVSFNWRCCIVLTLIVCVRSDQEREMSCEKDFFRVYLWIYEVMEIPQKGRTNWSNVPRHHQVPQFALTRCRPKNSWSSSTWPMDRNLRFVCSGSGPRFMHNVFGKSPVWSGGKHHDLQECVCEFKFSLCQSVWFEWDAWSG